MRSPLQSGGSSAARKQGCQVIGQPQPHSWAVYSCEWGSPRLFAPLCTSAFFSFSSWSPFPVSCFIRGSARFFLSAVAQLCDFLHLVCCFLLCLIREWTGLRPGSFPALQELEFSVVSATGGTRPFFFLCPFKWCCCGNCSDSSNLV